MSAEPELTRQHRLAAAAAHSSDVHDAQAGPAREDETAHGAPDGQHDLAEVWDYLSKH